MSWLARLLPISGDQSDERAMRAVQERADPAAFAKLVNRWEAPIRRLCTRMTGDEHFGEDLAQETFARVFAHRHQFLPDRKFSTWLWRIAVNLCHEQGRRKRLPQSPLEDEVLACERSEQLETDEEATLVRAALSELPDKLREVVVLREYEGLKFREVAEILQIPLGTVQSRMADALNQLSRKLRPFVDVNEREVDSHVASNCRPTG